MTGEQTIVVAITGASGSAYAVRLLQVLASAGREIHLVISPAAVQVFRQELDLQLDLERLDPTDLVVSEEVLAASEPLRHLGFTTCQAAEGQLRHYRLTEYAAGIASGSFLTSGMVICPCSMGTLGAIAGGLSTNLIHRAADVHLKERRKLVLVPRETPLSPIQLRNMTRVAEAGAVILPAMPGLYLRPRSVMEMVEFVVARVCDQLGVDHSLIRRWST